MRAYRIYRLADDGRVQEPPNLIFCDDDDSAITKAYEYVFPSRVIEIWQGARRVGQIHMRLGE